MANQEDWEDVDIDDGWEDVNVDSRDQPSSQSGSSVLPYAEKYISPAREAGKKVLNAAGSVFEYVDRFTGAPIRKGIGEAMEYDPSKAISEPNESVGMKFAKGFASQFGEPSAKAPSGKDLASSAGISTQEYDTGLRLNPFTGENLKVSPAGIVGGVGESLLDPLAAASLAGATPARMAKGAYRAGEVIGETGTKYGGRVTFGIPVNQIEHYMKDPMAAEKAFREWPMENLEGQIVGDVSKIKNASDEALRRKEMLEAHLKDLYKQRQMDIKQKTVPLDVVRNIQGQMENEKAILGALSEKSDDVLANSNVSFEKNHLIRLINKIGESQGKYIVGDAASDALEKLYKTRNKLKSLPQTLDGPLLRDVMRQIREDIDFARQFGQFNKRLNRMRKQFTDSVSDALKYQVPEYAELMQDMHKRADSLEAMSEAFGTEGKGIGTLATIKKGGIKSPILDKTLREFSSVIDNEDLPRLLNEYQSDLALQNRMQRGDISRELFPNDASQIDDASKIYNEKRSKFDLVSPLSEARTQAVINQQQGPSGGRLYDKRALEALSQETGIPYNQIIQDAGSYRAFGKDATRGSKMMGAGAFMGTGMGTVVGGGPVGGAVGGGIGAAIGFAGDRLGGPALRSGIKYTIGAKRGFEKAIKLVVANPVFASKYGKIFKSAIDRGGYPAAELYHNMLMNNDAEYQKYFEETQ